MYYTNTIYIHTCIAASAGVSYSYNNNTYLGDKIEVGTRAQIP